VTRIVGIRRLAASRYVCRLEYPALRSMPDLPTSAAPTRFAGEVVVVCRERDGAAVRRRMHAPQADHAIARRYIRLLTALAGAKAPPHPPASHHSPLMFAALMIGHRFSRQRWYKSAARAIPEQGMAQPIEGE
jgi:hypothetical protein